MVITSEKDAIGMEVDGTVNSLLNATEKHAIKENKKTLAAKINIDNLCELCDLPSYHNYSPNNNSIFTLFLDDMVRFSTKPRVIPAAT